jgi:hypothetical protein
MVVLVAHQVAVEATVVLLELELHLQYKDLVVALVGTITVATVVAVVAGLAQLEEAAQQQHKAAMAGLDYKSI